MCDCKDRLVVDVVVVDESLCKHFWFNYGVFHDVFYVIEQNM